MAQKLPHSLDQQLGIGMTLQSTSDSPAGQWLHHANLTLRVKLGKDKILQT